VDGLGNQVSKSGITGPVGARSGRSSGHLAKPLELSLHLPAKVGNHFFLPLSEPPGLAYKMRQTALPGARPPSVEPVTVTYKGASPLSNPGLKGLFGAPRVHQEVGTKAVGHHPEPLQGIFSPPEGLIHKTYILLGHHLPYGLGAALYHLLNSALAHREVKHRAEELLYRGSTVSLHPCHLPSKGSESGAVTCLMRIRHLSLIHLAAMGTAPLVQNKVGDFQSDLRKRNLLVGVKGLELLEPPRTTPASLWPYCDHLCGLKHHLAVPLVTLFGPRPAFLLVLVFPQRAVRGRGLVGVLGVSPILSLRLLQPPLKGFQLVMSGDQCYPYRPRGELPIHSGYQGDTVLPNQELGLLIQVHVPGTINGPIYSTVTKMVQSIKCQKNKIFNQISSTNVYNPVTRYKFRAHPVASRDWTRYVDDLGKVFPHRKATYSVTVVKHNKYVVHILRYRRPPEPKLQPKALRLLVMSD